MPRIDTDIAPADRDRYTLDGDAAVEARIAHDQELVAQAVTARLAPPAFRGLVLMGGYGRGEGGFVRRDGQPEPYNDYDYFVVVRGLDGAARAALTQDLAVAAKALEHQVGVEVDFALLREERLPGAEYSLMNAEMLWGHRVVAGDPQVLATMPAMPFASLPPGEFTRLLLNRGSLLLLNQRRLANPEPLAAARTGNPLQVSVQGHPGLRGCPTGRQRLLPSLLPQEDRAPGNPGLAGEGRLPGPLPPGLGEQVPPRLRPLRRRGRRGLAGAGGPHLAGDPGLVRARARGPAHPGLEHLRVARLRQGPGGKSWGGLRNALITLRDFGPTELLRRPAWSRRYPRERLIAALPLLLENPGAPASPVLANALALAPGASWQDAVAAFLGLWRRFA